MRRYKIGDGELDGIEQKIVADIARYGWHVMHVLGDDQGEPYSYTIGVYQSYGRPELAIFALSPDDAHAVLATLLGHIQEGRQFEPGVEYADLVEGRTVAFMPVDGAWYEMFFGRAIDLYGTLNFPILHCIWADAAGHMPWSHDFDPILRPLQPNLTSPAVDPETARE
ncbi:MAG TPA: DUF4262 domain-containing protein [Chloroflexota bacterium]|nr:DUF4262 domain-containing protein [Chloroflexota bacterium]